MKEFKLTKEELEHVIREAFRHGQINREMMEAGLERSEIDDYTASVMSKTIQREALKELTQMGDYGSTSEH
jgi:hypothetical protein